MGKWSKASRKKARPVTGDGSLLPAVILIDPKYPRNVSETIRACSCLGVPRVWVTGDRVLEGLGELSPKGKTRLPREERIVLWQDVTVSYCDYPFDAYRHGYGHHHEGETEIEPGHEMCFRNPRIVAVEIDPSATSLTEWGRAGHPEDCVYVFGPEDGSVPSAVSGHCTDFVCIPTKEDPDGKPACLNLYSAVSVMLGDRKLMKERMKQ